MAPPLKLTLLQKSLERSLDFAAINHDPSIDGLKNAWIKSHRWKELSNIKNFMVDLDDRNGSRLLAQIDTTISRLNQAELSISPRVAQLLTEMVLVGIERVVQEKGLSLCFEDFEPKEVPLGETLHAIIAAACAYNFGLLLRTLSGAQALGPLNVITDVRASEFGLSDRKQAILAEVDAVMQAAKDFDRSPLRDSSIEEFIDRKLPSDLLRGEIDEFRDNHNSEVVVAGRRQNSRSSLSAEDYKLLYEEYGIRSFVHKLQDTSQAETSAHEWSQVERIICKVADRLDKLLTGVKPQCIKEGAMLAQRSRVFICYSHHSRDQEWLESIVQHLGVLERQERIDVWLDKKIGAGQLWETEIRRSMESARVAVILVSSASLASKFINGTEIPRILAQNQVRGMAVMPVLIRDCAWQAVPWLSEMQMRPGAIPLSNLPSGQADSALASIALEINQMLQDDGLR